MNVKSTCGMNSKVFDGPKLDQSTRKHIAPADSGTETMFGGHEADFSKSNNHGD